MLQSAHRPDIPCRITHEEFLKVIQNEGNYRKNQEKAHGQIEIREYYQTEDIKWLNQKKNWKGLKSIVMEKKTINIEEASRAVRGHWSVESMHWHLDVTFKEDANATIDKMAAQNLNIIRK